MGYPKIKEKKRKTPVWKNRLNNKKYLCEQYAFEIPALRKFSQGSIFRIVGGRKKKWKIAVEIYECDDVRVLEMWQKLSQGWFVIFGTWRVKM